MYLGVLIVTVGIEYNVTVKTPADVPCWSSSVAGVATVAWGPGGQTLRTKLVLREASGS